MKITRLFVFAMLVVFANLAIGQSQAYSFNHSKSAGNRNIVYFKIVDLIDDVEEHDRVLELLLFDENIFDGNIYSVDENNASCQLELLSTISVDYIRKILQTAGYDMHQGSVTDGSPTRPYGIYYSENYSFFHGFDGNDNYNANESGLTAEEYYAMNKEKWIKNNAEKYEQTKKESGVTVIVKKKDLDFFKEEKRQHILNHPEIFIIED